MSGVALRSFAGLSNKISALQLVSFRCASNLIKKDDDVITHTGQFYPKGDYRQARFVDNVKLVNKNFAIDLIEEDPVVVCKKRVVSSNSGGALGHPNIYINLDAPGVHICGYSGRKFVLKKYYHEKAMGPHITYEEYCEQIGANPDY